MSQYSYYSKEVPKYWTDSVTGLRTRCWIDGDNIFKIDTEISATGFDGVEGTDWVCVESHETEITGDRAREGVRDEQYFLDAELTETGFDGTEDDDWCVLKGGL